MSEEQEAVYKSWSILELMGRRRLGGLVTEVVIAGAGLLRIDIPAPDGTFQTQMYGAQAIYCLTPTTEELARAVALRNQPEPVYRYELPALIARDEEFARYTDDEDNDADDE